MDLITLINEELGREKVERLTQRCNKLHTTTLSFHLEFLQRAYSDPLLRIPTQDIVFLALHSYMVPLAIISDNKRRRHDICAMLCSIIDKNMHSYSHLYNKPAPPHTHHSSLYVDKVFQLARNIQASTKTGDSEKKGWSHMMYSQDVKVLSKHLEFDLLNDRKYFPFSNTCSSVKCNVFMRDVVIDVLSSKSVLSLEVLTDLLFLSSKQTVIHNQAAAALIYACNIDHKISGPDRATFLQLVRKILYMLLNQHSRLMASEIISFLKVLGAPNDSVLVLLTELNVLLGKDVPEQSFLENDLKRRTHTGSSLHNPYISDTNVIKLRHVLEKLYKTSVAHMNICTPDEYWLKRWARTKSGAHKTRDELLTTGTILTNVDQPTRRNFIESRSSSPMFCTDPCTLISPSIKHENGKNRAIYSCDTINYLNFDYFAGHIEDAWINPRIKLKPSVGADHDSHRDIIDTCSTHFLSLDYDDFNSQHSLLAMKAVVEVFSRDFPIYIRNWLVSSFDNMQVSTTGEKWIATLPSGHRLTTFINSILNYAYLDMVFDMDRVNSIHTGDDCLIMGVDVNIFNSLLSAVYTYNESGMLRINRKKQILGSCGEFLRFFYSVSDKCNRVTGYVSRSIASLVNGSWTNAAALNPNEYIDSLSGMLHTIRTRLHITEVRGMLSTIIRRLGVSFHEAYDYCSGVLSINKSPVVCNTGFFKCIDIKTKTRTIFKKGGAKNASIDYYNTISKRMPVIFSKIRKYKRSIINMMANLSLVDKREVVEVKYDRYITRPGNIVDVDINDVELTYKMSGYLAKIMPFPLIRNALTPHEVTNIMNHLGKEIWNYEVDVWGMKSRTVIYSAFISYKDLKMAGHVFEKVVNMYSNHIIY